MAMLSPWMSPPYLWSILLALYGTQPCPSPDAYRETLCMPTVRVHRKWIFRIHWLSFSVIFVPIPFMLTFTNANPITDAQICQSKAISATSKGFDLKVCGSFHSLKKLCLAFYLGPISQSWLWYRCLTFTWFYMLKELYCAHFI